MKTLLNIVHNPLVEIRWVFAEHSEAGSGLRHDCLVTGSDGLDEIMLKQANDSVRISLRHWAVGAVALPRPPRSSLPRSEPQHDASRTHSNK